MTIELRLQDAPIINKKVYGITYMGLLSRLLGNKQGANDKKWSKGKSKSFELMAKLHSKVQQGENVRVLGVDDNVVNNKVLKAMIEKMGYEYTSAISGQQALDIYTQSSSFDLILMDCEMPGMDGYEATSKLRSLEASKKNAPIPIVAVTGNVLESDKTKCFNAGMNDFINKPVKLEKLKELIEGR